MRKPKFEIDDIVMLKDDICLCTSIDAIIIGKIIAIHIRKKYIQFSLPKYEVTYTVSGFNIKQAEENLKLYNEFNKGDA